MGRTHVTSGIVVGLATLPLVNVDNATVQTAWVLALAGSSLLPDLDSPHATASRMWGPLTGTFSALIAWVSRGHRWGTHDAILGPLAGAALVLLAATNMYTFAFVLALAVGLLVQGLVSTGFGRVGAALNFVVSVAVGWWLTAQGAAELASWLAVVVPLGMLVHIAGDLITTEGVPVPVAWLFSRRCRIKLFPVRTGGPLENAVITPGLGLVGLWLLAAHLQITSVSSLVNWLERFASTAFV